MTAPHDPHPQPPEGLYQPGGRRVVEQHDVGRPGAVAGGDARGEPPPAAGRGAGRGGPGGAPGPPNPPEPPPGRAADGWRETTAAGDGERRRLVVSGYAPTHPRVVER